MKLYKKLTLVFAVVLMTAFSLFGGDTASAWRSPWQYSSWGAAWIGFDDTWPSGWFAFGEVDDIKTDGYCVEIRLRVSGQSWPGTLADSDYTSSGKAVSCGPIVKWTNVDPNVPIAGARMYRGNGNYLTIFGS
ncbi:hypothetical protein IPM09_05210 [Candidatus Saccharibacteria bacterium]|nr:MAG: hypothetical protein IPM09_05210 [Candidatus Saccharibacteria bacterium]